MLMTRTNGNAALALLLSTFLSFIVTGVYVFYPLIWSFVASPSGYGYGSGIGAIGTGTIGLFLMIATLFFFTIFNFLQSKERQHR